MTASSESDVTISVITPCYNGAAYIAETIRSVLSQTKPALEMIVIDDGSTDDSAAIAEGFGAPVRIIRQSNQGESVARNRGIAEAKGSHLFFLDADDLVAPEAFQRLAAAIAGNCDAVALMGYAWFTNDPTQPERSVLRHHAGFYPDIIQGNFGPPHCWLTPKTIVQSTGGFCETMRWFEDWDLWWRVGLKADELRCVGHVGAYYRQHVKSQLATTRPHDRALGHATLVGRMTTAVLQRPDLLQPHGEALYWSAWAALVHARTNGVSWTAVRPLAEALLTLTRRGPSSVTSLSSAKLVRILGVRGALALQQALGVAKGPQIPTQVTSA
jgi:hypothetical protein